VSAQSDIDKFIRVAQSKRATVEGEESRKNLVFSASRTVLIDS
jgi:hypothetical protein